MNIKESKDYWKWTDNVSPFPALITIERSVEILHEYVQTLPGWKIWLTNWLRIPIQTFYQAKIKLIVKETGLPKFFMVMGVSGTIYMAVDNVNGVLLIVSREPVEEEFISIDFKPGLQLCVTGQPFLGT